MNASRFFGVAALVAVAPSVVHAQAALPSLAWQGWVGCWTSTPPGEVWQSRAGAARLVCVSPADKPDVVDITAISEGTVVSHEKIDASGNAANIDLNGCTGNERAKWSGDKRRVYLKSLVTCQGLTTEMSAVIALTPGGDWLDVRSYKVPEGQNVRVTRYRPVDMPAGVPAAIASAINAARPVALSARHVTGAPISNDAIIEASKVVDAEVVEAWVMENGQAYAVDGKSIRELEDAGVSPLITGAMIAATEPDRSPLTRAGGRYYGYTRPYGRGASDAWDQGTGMRVAVRPYPAFLDPWAFGGWPFGYRYGYDPYGYAIVLGARAGYGMFGFGYTMVRSLTGYVYPQVLVLHQDPSGTGKAQAVAKKDDGTEVKTKSPTAQAISDAITKGAGKSSGSSSAPKPPPTPAGVKAGGGGKQ